ncbi:NAD(P)/FAD-dependent oxidoreductase [Salisaeta longa]|uniref:NAD(P)/FAD-dependent oxidoreductase n=1 Tax=Salisaeta longa TaxID=503170 RepID=UPI0003B34F13|nr:NAD(P)/FAD-dependent oxidoreductase [Salisaeta longa]
MSARITPIRADASVRPDAPHVVVVGAGFAGLEAAKALMDAPVQVTVVDKNNYHTFQPLLYEVAMAGLEPDDIAQNVRSVLQGADNVRFRMAAVEQIDTSADTVALSTGDRLAYDYLVLAGGAVSNDFGVPGVADHAFPLKEVTGAVRLRNHVLRQFEAYDQDPERAPEGQLTFTIVGGGPTGVEMAGALVELFDTLNRDFTAFDTRDVARCVLVEMSDRLLGGYDEEIQAYTAQVLRSRGVEVRTGATVEEVTSTAVRFADGPTLPSRTVVWGAGVKANPLAEQIDAERAGGGRLVVSQDLRVPGLPRVFAVGDVAAIADGDDYLPQLAQVAIQSGRHAAAEVRRHVLGVDPEPFAYTDLGQMATIGRNAAVAEFPTGHTMKGAFAWLVWVFIHIAKLVGFRNRLSALVNWAYNYFTYSRSARLILDVNDPSGAAQQEPREEDPQPLREVVG